MDKEGKPTEIKKGYTPPGPPRPWKGGEDAGFSPPTPPKPRPNRENPERESKSD